MYQDIKILSNHVHPIENQALPKIITHWFITSHYRHVFGDIKVYDQKNKETKRIAKKIAISNMHLNKIFDFIWFILNKYFMHLFRTYI